MTDQHFITAILFKSYVTCVLARIANLMTVVQPEEDSFLEDTTYVKYVETCTEAINQIRAVETQVVDSTIQLPVGVTRVEDIIAKLKRHFIGWDTKALDPQI